MSVAPVDRGWATVPNAISLVRLLCVPLFVVLLFGVETTTGAAALLAILGFTDWVDGYIARRFDQQSTVGKVLDPMADRALILTAVVSLYAADAIGVFLLTAIAVREAVVIFAFLLLATRGTRIDVNLLGKAGAFALMIALPLFLLASDDTSAATAFLQSARAAAALGVIGYYASLVGYCMAIPRSLTGPPTAAPAAPTA